MYIPSQPSLFELAGRPTTRALARGVREAGAAGLPDGVRRGGNTVYQEIACRSALNRVDGMPFRWTLNPYRGCTHGCHYCFARRYQSHLELGAGDDFSSVVLVKTNFAEVLARELSRRSLDGEMVALGTATDPYQPIEGRHRLTRRTLSILIRHSTPVGLITLRRQARVRFLHHPLPDRHGCAAGETRSAERARAGCRAAACRRNEA